MSAARTFPEERIEQPDAGPHMRIPAMRINCSECDAVDYFPHLNNGVRKPPIAAVQHFQRKGWIVGSAARKDLCPIHAHPRETKPVPDAQPSNVTQLHAEPPREMSRDDRRIIMEKLDDVYEKERYKTPWTDTAVATDLGVPRAWVAEVRDAFFGPEGSNPLLDDYLARAAAHAARVEEFNTHCREIERLAGEAITMKKTIIEDAAEILRIGRRIEKELGR